MQSRTIYSINAWSTTPVACCGRACNCLKYSKLTAPPPKAEAYAVIIALSCSTHRAMR